MPEIDWSARLSTGELILCTAAAAATTATTGVYAGLTATAPAAIGTTAACAQIIRDTRRGATRTATTVRVASWLTAAGWTTCQLAAHHLPTDTGWLTAACATILAAAANWSVNRTEPARQHDRATLMFKRQAVKTMDEWHDRIERVTRIKGCRILPGLQPWPEEAGYTLEVELPEGGTTWKELATHADAFAADMRLPDGCGVEIAKGANRGRVIIRVSTRDMISETVYYTEDWTELDFNDSWSFGFHRDGTDALTALLDDCGIVIGDTGSGKTNLLNTMLMTLARMPAVLIWVIDTTGAGVALPWITPWALDEDGRDAHASAPVVDWVATSPAEARIMLRMAVEIIGARKTRYQSLMRAHNTDKIPVSHDVPAIVIAADEVAELDNDIQALIDSVMNTGRATRVRALNSALRGTQDTITAAMKKRAKFRVGMHTEDPEELAYLFSGYQVLDMADAPVPGSGFYTYGAGGPRPFKARRLEPDAITRGCIACADRRPTLDPISLDVSLAPQYRGRWARTLPQLYPDTERFADQVENYLARLAEDAFAELAEEARVAIDINGDEGADDDQVTAAMKNALGPASEMTGPVTIDQIDAMFAAAGTTGEPPTADRDGGGEASDFDRVMAQTGETPPAAPPDLVKPQVKPRTLTPELRAYTLLYEAGPDGTGAKQLSTTLDAQDVNAPRTTVQGWLKNWAENGKAVRTGSGSHTRYVHTAHATDEDRRP